MAEDQHGVRPILAADYPAALQVPEQDFSNSLDDLLRGVWDGDGGEQRIDDFPIGLKDAKQDPFGLWSAPPATYNVTFPRNGAFSHDVGSSIQVRSPTVDEILASHNPAATPATPATLKCAWPGCRSSFRRKADLIRHVNSQHFPAHSYRCTVEGCTRTFYRRDKLRDHERHSHRSEVAPSQKDTSTTTTARAANGARDMRVGFLALNTEDRTYDGMDPQPSFLRQSDEQVRQTWSSPATEASYDQSQDFSRTSDGLSGKDSVSTRSTSSHGTISSKNRSELRPAGWAGEIDNTSRQFACPFRKHDRDKYDIHKHSVCAMSSWKSVARLKEHLARRHRAPLQCRRCWTVFKSQECLDIHLIGTPPCEIQAGSPAEGITAEIETRLKSRHRSWSEERKWTQIYLLLFPNSQVPSPYFEPIEEVAPTERSATTNVSLFAPNQVQTTQPSDPYMTSYLPRDFPRIFNSHLQEALNKELPALEDKLRSELVSIVADCHDKLIRSYEERSASNQGVLTPSTGTIVDLDNRDVDMVSGMGEPEFFFEDSGQEESCN